MLEGLVFRWSVKDWKREVENNKVLTFCVVGMVSVAMEKYDMYLSKCG